MKSSGLFCKFIITVIILFIICQVAFLTIYSYPSKKTVLSEIPSDNKADIEEITVDKGEKRKGKSAGVVTITDYQDASRLKDYARILHLEIMNTDASYLKDLQGMELGSLYLYNASEFDITTIDFNKLKSLSVENTKVINMEKLHNSPLFTTLSINGADTENKDYLKGFKNLTSLTLQNMQLKDLSFINDMKNMRHLSIVCCGISNISPLSDLKNITSLCLEGNNITDITPVKNMPHLEALDISYNKIKGTLDLSSNPRITTLDAQFNNLNEIKLHKDISCYTNLSYNNISELNEDTLNIMSHSPSVNLFGNNIMDYEQIRNSDNFVFANENYMPYTYDEHKAYINSLNEFCRKYLKPEWSELKKAAISYLALSYTGTIPDKADTSASERTDMKSEYLALVNKKAFSDGFSNAYRDILRSNGIDSYIYHGELFSDITKDHTWNIVYIDSKPYHCDISANLHYNKEALYFDTAEFFKKYMDSFGKSDNKFEYKKYTLSDRYAPKCSESLSESAISNIIYEIVNGEELYLFSDKEQYKEKKALYETESRNDQNE